MFDRAKRAADQVPLWTERAERVLQRAGANLGAMLGALLLLAAGAFLLAAGAFARTVRA